MTATSAAAKALRLEREIGSIAVGLRADVVVVHGNPLENIALLQKPDNIRTVVRGGEIVVDRRPGRERRLIVDPEWMARVDALGHLPDEQSAKRLVAEGRDVLREQVAVS